jgi:predicted permease
LIVHLLIRKIASFFLILLSGFFLVRRGVLKSEDSQALSKISLYLLVPGVILSAFQVDYSDEARSGLMITFAASILIMGAQILLNKALRKPLRLESVEQVSVVYSNAGNLVVPLVISVLGREWAIYSCSFMAVQQILFWTHCKSVLIGETKFSLRRIVANVNVLSIVLGLVLFLTGQRIPGFVGDTVETFGSMNGAVCMLLMGILIGGMKLKNVFTYKRVWLIAALRLIVVPLLVLLLLKGTTLSRYGDGALLVTFLATTTPPASTLTSMSLVYGADAEYASSINVVTTLCGIVTMPIMVFLYTIL